MLDLAAHIVFHVMQGQGCKSACAVCLPNEAEAEKLARGETPTLRSVRVERKKGVLDKVLWAPVMPIDTLVGGLVGGIAAILPAFGIGIAAGTGVGGLAGSSVGSAVGNTSLAGAILGLSSGLATGVVSGVGVAAALELTGILVGALKGVDLTAALTDCERVGFRRSLNGKWMDEGKDRDQPFTTIPPLGKYGLERLREWMAKNEDQSNLMSEEIFPHDEQSVHHCERLRTHNFDMRHLQQCVRHSQLCGPSGAVIVPLGYRNTCRSLSSADVLEQWALRAGDDPETGFFAQWKQMRSETSGTDDTRSKCIQLLCEHRGFRKASLKFHPDRINNMKISDEEKETLTATMSFLSQCKLDFQDKGLDGLLQNTKEARVEHCAPPLEKPM
eukprot:TRINITY_DN48949_c0_g1_i1.p1 TRINITY_DN48949_c0_g1~~TRINITY_DN48949_c0_g1_i1.p1  ORF type:complete len:387 (-),score=78.08 TRINITY_DN48949_c0_g1_i1:48-1208(-)